MSDKLLSICFINLNGTEKLAPAISNLISTINHLDGPLKEKIEVIVSDNKSDDIGDLKEVLRTFNNVDLVSTLEQGGVDINIMNCFNQSSGDYCWIFAVDDYINSTSHLKYLLETLHIKKPDMLSFNIGLETTQFQEQQHVEAAQSITQNLKFLINSGKISTCIYKRKDCHIECLELARPFCGVGYFHLSYGASLNKLGHTSHLFIHDYFVHTLHSKVNHRHDYHPKYSQRAHLAVANDYFLKESPKLRFITNNHLLFQLKFIFEIYKNDNFLQWKEEYLHHYITEIGSEARSSGNLIIKIVYYIVLLKLFSQKDKLCVYESFVRLKENSSGL